jgi:hypothetical protein
LLKFFNAIVDKWRLKVENAKHEEKAPATVASIKRLVGYEANNSSDARANKRDRMDVDGERQGMQAVNQGFYVSQV